MEAKEKTTTALANERVTLYPKQRLFYFSPATEVLFGGAAGPGKSLSLRVSGIRWCERVPGIQVYLFRRTFPDLRLNHLRGPKSLKVLLARQLAYGSVKYNKTENEFVWQETGSVYSLHHCQNEDDVEGYQGAEIHVLQIDELTHFTEYMYSYLRGRVRCVGLDIPERYKKYLPRIETGSNPGSIGHKFVKKVFVGLQPLHIVQMPDEEGGLLRQFIPARLDDNPSLLKDDPKYRARLKAMSPALARAMEEGDWDIYEGQFFDEWRKDVHVLPWEFKAADHWTWFFSYDYGFGHPATFYACAVDEQGTVYVMHEIAERRKHVDDFAKMVKAKIGEALYAKIKSVHTGWDCFLPDKDGGISIAEKFSKLDPDPVLGKIRLPLVKATVDRVSRAAHFRDYLKWKIETDEQGKQVQIGPRMFVHPSCTRLISCIPALIHDPGEPEAPLKVDATEQDPWAGDDPYEGCSYGLMSRPRLPKIDAPFVQKSYDQRVHAWLDKRKAKMSRGPRLKDPTLGGRW